MAAFFFPEVHRKGDFIWSGVGLFYALILWACAGRITGAVLLGQGASVSLIGWLGWQAITLRRAVAPVGNRTPVPANVQQQLTNVLQTPPIAAATNLQPMSFDGTGDGTGATTSDAAINPSSGHPSPDNASTGLAANPSTEITVEDSLATPTEAPIQNVDLDRAQAPTTQTWKPVVETGEISNASDVRSIAEPDGADDEEFPGEIPEAEISDAVDFGAAQSGLQATAASASVPQPITQPAGQSGGFSRTINTIIGTISGAITGLIGAIAGLFTRFSRKNNPQSPTSSLTSASRTTSPTGAGNLQQRIEAIQDSELVSGARASLNQAAQKVADVVEDIKDSELVSEVKDSLGKVAEKITDGIEDIKDSELVSEARESLDEATQTIRDKAEDIVEGSAATLANLAEGAADRLEKVSEKLDDVAASVSEPTSEPISETIPQAVSEPETVGTTIELGVQAEVAPDIQTESQPEVSSQTPDESPDPSASVVLEIIKLEDDPTTEIPPETLEVAKNLKSGEVQPPIASPDLDTHPVEPQENPVLKRPKPPGSGRKKVTPKPIEKPDLDNLDADKK